MNIFHWVGGGGGENPSVRKIRLPAESIALLGHGALYGHYLLGKHRVTHKPSRREGGAYTTRRLHSGINAYFEAHWLRFYRLARYCV